MEDYCDSCGEWKEVEIYTSLPFEKICSACTGDVLEMYDELHADD
jgi:hypothetical protein